MRSSLLSWTTVASIYGVLAVVAGAFGAHGLRSRLTETQLGAWETAASYHLLHSAVLLALALYGSASGRPVTLPGALIAAGVLLFSGSIYLLATTSQTWLGPVTPIGGTLLIAGWASMLTLARS